MPTYILLSRWTDQGIKNVDQVANREKGATAAAACMQVSQTLYFTLGEYDAVNIIEAPDDETAAVFALEIGTHGNLRTTTMRAFTAPEFLDLLAKRPRWSIPEGD